MQKQEIPPFSPCHSGSDLALNQLVLLQAISRPPWRHYECSFNSRGPLGPLSTVPTWWVAGRCSSSHKQNPHNTVQIKEQRRRESCLSTAEKYPVVSINGPLLCGQEGLVPFHDHCIEVTLCLLSSVFSCAYSNLIQSSCGWFLSSCLSDKMWWEWKWQSLKDLCTHDRFPKSKGKWIYLPGQSESIYIFLYSVLLWTFQRRIVSVWGTWHQFAVV